MSPITLDAAISSQLNGLGQVVELADPSGKILGRFVPLVDLSKWEPTTPEISEEELDRRERSGEKRYTTTQVLAHLDALSRRENL